MDPITFRPTAETRRMLNSMIERMQINQSAAINLALTRLYREEIDMPTKTWDRTASVYRDDYRTEAEYRKAYQECNRHYGFKVRVDGGWKFFQYEDDYRTWKNQK